MNFAAWNYLLLGTRDDGPLTQRRPILPPPPESHERLTLPVLAPWPPDDGEDEDGGA